MNYKDAGSRMDDDARQDHCDDTHEPKAPEERADGVVVERAASILRAMGDHARLRLLERLSSQEMCVSELASASDDGMSTISQRLKALRAEGLVSRRRQGKHIYYQLADDHVAELLQAVLAHAAEESPRG